MTNPVIDMLKEIHTRGLRVFWSYRVPSPMWADTEERLEPSTWDFIYTQLGQDQLIPEKTHYVHTGIQISWERHIVGTVTFTGPQLDSIDDAFKYTIQKQPIIPYEIEVQVFGPSVWANQPIHEPVTTLKYRARFTPSESLQQELVEAGVLADQAAVIKVPNPGESIASVNIDYLHDKFTEPAQTIWTSEYLTVSKVDQDDWIEEHAGLLMEYTLTAKALEMIGVNA